MQIFIIILLGYLLLAAGYYLFFAVGSLLKSQAKRTSSLVDFNKIAVMIPAYKEDGVIVDSAIKALDQVYPPTRYSVYVIADSLQEKTLQLLRELPIQVVEVSFEKSTKAKALNTAMQQLDSSYQIAVVLDADNVMELNFLQHINQAYNTGLSAMQGHRVAKNQENNLAILDAISEEINNGIFRKGHQAFGLSSALIGSGMAFDLSLFKNEMAKIDAIGGFDKELELRLLKRKIRIGYLEEALVYDEKVSKTEAFTNQRTRWIAAQIRYGLSSFGDAVYHLITRGNLDYFDKSLQFLLPPRLILLGLLTVLAVLFTALQFPYWEWTLGGWAALIAALLIATPSHLLNRKAAKACLHLPKTFWLMIKALAGFKKAKNNFLHTPHQSVHP
ncbi:glycosyltransferase [Marinoscillum sp.]|uniref:glycosyltransferase n=1 Tax=Marinoscillum sp. TaxID=2024838 RepID=UPI003BAAA3B2